MIKLLIFDAGNVLYKAHLNREIRKVVRRFLLSKGIKDFKKERRVWNKLKKLGRVGKLNLKQCHEKWLEALGLDKRLVKEWNRILKDFWLKHSFQFPKVNETLKELKRRGYKLAVLSDTIESKKEKIEKLKLFKIDYKLFDEIFTSHDIGYEKPHKKAFEKVWKFFKVKPNETIFVGHDEELEGAKKLGMITISFRNPKARADFFCRKFEDLLKIIEKIEREKIRELLGKTVKIKIDRPLGSRHPKWKWIYPVNYGYVEGIKAPDDENLDAYVLGVFKPIKEFKGKVIAIIHRKDDNEDKLIVAPKGKNYTKDQIKVLVEFQERWFKSEIIV